MENRTKVLALARRKGILRAEDLESAGISRNYLYSFHRMGLLRRNARGIYSLPESPTTERALFAEIAKRVPRAVVCLLSALLFHEITTQLPREIWLAVPRGSWRPNIVYPPLILTYLSGEAYSFGIEKYDVGGVEVKVYSPAKTVADCFKFRNKVGLDVAIETLREVWRSRKATADELFRAAEINRVARTMRPYMEAIV